MITTTTKGKTLKQVADATTVLMNAFNKSAVDKAVPLFRGVITKKKLGGRINGHAATKRKGWIGYEGTKPNAMQMGKPGKPNYRKAEVTEQANTRAAIELKKIFTSMNKTLLNNISRDAKKM